MERHSYKKDQIYGFGILFSKANLERNPNLPPGAQLSRGWWEIDCYGPSHPGEKEVYYANTRDLYLMRPYALGCTKCQPAVLDWLRQNKIPITGDTDLPDRLRARATRPPAPIAEQIAGRLFLAEWVPTKGWTCLCLCGCGSVETIRTTQLVWQSALRRCGVTGRLRPATGLKVTYGEKETVIETSETPDTDTNVNV